MAQKPIIGLIIATRMEAVPFLEGLECRKIQDFPFEVFLGEDAVIVISGIGKVNAAMASAFAAMTFSPACIINAGAAGGIRPDERTGAIYQMDAVFEPDRLHFKTGKAFRHHPDVLDGIPTARLATLDRAVVKTADRQAIAPVAELVDMEGAAVVQVAGRFQIPCYLLKFVSDTPGHTRIREIPMLIRQHRDAFFDFFMAAVWPGLGKQPDSRQ